MANNRPVVFGLLKPHESQIVPLKESVLERIKIPNINELCEFLQSDIIARPRDDSPERPELPIKSPKQLSRVRHEYRESIAAYIKAHWEYEFCYPVNTPLAVIEATANYLENL